MSFIKSHVISIGLICFVLAGACLLYLHARNNEMSDRGNASQALTESGSAASTTEVNGIHFEIVTTPAAQELGLGGRAVIPDNYGMLFVFPEDEMPGFWMKDMLAPIDMIWLTDAGAIASITPSVLPSTYPEAFYPPTPIRYVLEARAGFAAEKGWGIGTVVALPPPY